MASLPVNRECVLVQSEWYGLMCEGESTWSRGGGGCYSFTESRPSKKVWGHIGLLGGRGDWSEGTLGERKGGGVSRGVLCACVCGVGL